MRHLRTELVDRLEEYGLSVEVPTGLPDGDEGDHLAVLSRGASRQTFRMILQAHATQKDVARAFKTSADPSPVLLGAGSVSPRSADGLRRQDIQYVDTSGNAWINFGDVLIDVRGRRSRGSEFEAVRPRGGDVFSAARAQVAFALLEWPGLWKERQRDVADAAGVSLGKANDTLTTLRGAGFGPGGYRSDAELLDLWAAAFPTGLGQKLLLATYRGSVQDFRDVDPQDPVFRGGAVISGELAADDLLRPEGLTIYVPGLDPMLPVKNRWRSDGEANIIVRRRFWSTPPTGMYDDDGPPAGLRRAPAVLVYADLAASHDPRVRSVSAEWRRRVARPQHSR